MSDSDSSSLSSHSDEDLSDLPEEESEEEEEEEEETKAEEEAEAEEETEEEEEAEAEKKESPINQLITYVKDNWIEKKNNILNTVLDTNSLIENLTDKEFLDNEEKLAEMLSHAKNADGDNIFRNREEARDYINKIRQRKRSVKTFYIPKRTRGRYTKARDIYLVNDDVDREIRLQNAYSRDISPMMQKNIHSKEVGKGKPKIVSLYLKSYL